MTMILIGAMASLLVFFFERWWTANHPIAPTPQARLDFIALVHSKWRFRLLPRQKREHVAGALFDKFAAKYAAQPPVLDVSDAPLTADQANAIATHYADGLTLTAEEVG